MNPSTTATLSAVEPWIDVIMLIVIIYIFAKAEKWFRWLMVIVAIVLIVVFMANGAVHQ